MTTEPHNATETVEVLEQIAHEHKRVCIGDVLDEFGRRSFGPMLLLPALIELSPLGGIPGVPSLLALICATVAGQLLLGADHVWLPDFIQRRDVRSGRVMLAAKKLEGVAAWLDARFHGRWKRFTGQKMRRIAAVFILLLCALVPPLELLPFASSGPMLAIAAFGLAILVRDGLLLLAACAISLAVFGLSGYLIVTSDLVGGLSEIAS